MTVLVVKFDKRQMLRLEKTLREVPKGMQKVMSRSINRTLKFSKNESARQITSQITAGQRAIKKVTKILKATFKKWEGHIIISGSRIPLIRFAARKIKSGISYKIKRTGTRERIKSAFKATMSSGHRGVFARRGENRLPIVELRGPSMGRVFERDRGILRRTLRRINKKLIKNIDAQVKFLLRKHK